MQRNEFLSLIPVEARVHVDASRLASRTRDDGSARQVTANRRAFPTDNGRPVGPATNHPTQIITNRAQREFDRRTLRRLRADPRQITLRPAQIAFVHACFKHPVSVGLTSMSPGRRARMRSWLRTMGRTPQSHRGRCLITLACVLEQFGRSVDGHVIVTGLGLGHLASLLPSDRFANGRTHIGRGTLAARYHRCDRPRRACGTGDPRSGNCGLLHELRLAGLVLDTYQPSPVGAPRYGLGPSGFALLVVVLAADDDKPD